MLHASALGALVLSALALAAPTPSSDPQLGDAPCAAEVRALLDQWSPTRSWRRQGDLEDGTRVDRTPTEKAGTWLETRVHPTGLVDALRITARTTTKVSWVDKGEAACVPVLSVINREFDERRMKISFTDEDLNKELASGQNGVIYAWSPHMPLSMRGIPQAKAAAAKLGLKLIILLDPHANVKYARDTARELGLPEEYLKPMQSIELFNRGLANHYPAIQLYVGGKMAGPMVPGYKTGDYYERLFKETVRGEKGAQ